MPRRQFSIRGLLVLTAIISAVLAFAVRLPDVFRVLLIIAVPVLLIVAIFQSANFATSDRRPRIALLSWIALGIFFTLLAIGMFRMMVVAGGDLVTGPIIGLCILIGCAATCAVRAGRCYLMIRKPAAEADRISQPDASAGSQAQQSS
jgi:hypothetical protein